MHLSLSIYICINTYIPNCDTVEGTKSATLEQHVFIK